MFGRKKKKAAESAAQANPVDKGSRGVEAAEVVSPTATTGAETSAAAPAAAAESADDAAVGNPNYDPINGDFGPFDGDSVNYRDFDFSDFAKGGLDLSSILIPVPHEGEVQVEMGVNGPQMVHVLTPYGRITPVAFAAPSKGNMWEESIEEILAGLAGDGLEGKTETGPWGTEVTATAGEGTMRIIGVKGPRWMLRMTVAGPISEAENMTALARDITARCFVYRGKDPVLAGDALPVEIPAPMVEELRKQMEALVAQEAAQAEQEAAQEAEQPNSGGQQ